MPYCVRGTLTLFFFLYAMNSLMFKFQQIMIQLS